MPADIKTMPGAVRAETLQGAAFVFHSEEDRRQGIEKAFDYRGDVTLTVRGTPLECFLFNREDSASPPRVQIFIKGNDDAQVIPYADIEAIEFTGKDTADGKSWAAWVNKKESERQAEAERIRLEALEQGHL